MGVGVLALIAVLIVVWRLRATLAQRDNGGALALMQQQLDAMRSQLGQALAGHGQTVGTSHSARKRASASASTTRRAWSATCSAAWASSARRPRRCSTWDEA
jgi:hypothetical protein